MRIKTLEISGFRAFTTSHQFDLDADVVLINAVNGQGKTSFFDAILWAIAGEISRLGDSGSVVSMYSSSGEARVRVSIANDDGTTIIVTRRYDGQTTGLQVEVAGNVFRDEEGEYQIIRNLWPAGLQATDPRTALRSALQHGVYLQQDVITGFLTAETDQQRFNVFSEFIGSGAATDLQVALENSRRTWSEVTNRLQDRLGETESTLARLERQLQELQHDDASTSGINDRQWIAWWAQIQALGVSQTDMPNMASPEAQSAVDAAMAELRTLRLYHERRREDVRNLETLILRPVPEEYDIEELRQAAHSAQQELVTARQALADAEAIVSNVRRLHAEAISMHQDLVVLADVALRHLGESCPVCQQSYDRDGTRQRLEALRRSGEPRLGPLSDVPDLPDLDSHVRDLERQVTNATTALVRAEQQRQLRINNQERLRLGLDEFSINVPIGHDVPEAIESALEDNARQIENISAARIQGEAIALSLTRVGQQARKREIEQEMLRVSADLESARHEFLARRSTGELVSSMIESLRQASSDFVENELRRSEPLLQRIYSTVDPHPEFRVVRLLSQMRRGHGRIVAEVEDPIHDLRKDTPRLFLSSSQLNILAVSIFLTLNLGTPSLPLRTAMLDDPLQSLDDINLLGLTDLFKRIRQKRQLVVSTHDRRFSSLLERKLRPVSDSQRTICIDLSGWSGEGSITIQRDVERDQIPIKMVAA